MTITKHDVSVTRQPGSSIPHFPSRIVLELTPRCNLSCPMCPRQHVAMEDGDMGWPLFTRLAAEIQRENNQAVVLPFWRGESTLHPEFARMMELLLGKGLRVHLSTNGHVLDGQVKDLLYRCEFVTFSLHTERALANATDVLQRRPAWSRTTFQCSFVDSEPTATSLLQRCLSDPDLLGFDAVRLYVEHTGGGRFGQLSHPSKPLESLPTESKPGSEHLDFSGPLKSVDQENEARRAFCPKLRTTFVVAANGGYSRCNHLWNPCHPGSLVRSSISEIWNGPDMARIRADYPDASCQACDQWSGHSAGQVWRKESGGGITHRVF